MTFTGILLSCCLFIALGINGRIEAARIYSNGIAPERLVTVTVEVLNPIRPEQMCVSCWSVSGEHNQRKCYSWDNWQGSFSWDFEPNLNTVFWCSCQWGAAYIDQFPVYGSTASKFSSTWLVDSRGKRRILNNDNPVDDHVQLWSGDLPTTTTTTSTTTEPTTTTTTEPTTTTTTTTTTEPTTTTTTTEPTTTTTTTEPTTTTTTEPTTITTTTEPTTTTTTTEPTTTTTTTEPTTITTTTTTTEPTTTTTTTTTTTEPTTTTTTTEPTTTRTTTEPTTTTTTTEPTTITITTDLGPVTGSTTEVWDFDCPQPEGNFADPEDCTAFYSCTAGIVIGHQYCPDGLYFNPVINNCDYPWNVDCEMHR